MNVSPEHPIANAEFVLAMEKTLLADRIEATVLREKMEPMEFTLRRENMALTDNTAKKA